tara:strand:+ start:13642 stop:14145 length:504 start_codon:yes stop_codon:yes gene_type:complete
MRSLINGINYRNATLDDAELIKGLVLSAFKNNEGLFLPLEPTEHNAMVFYMLEIRPAIINKDPCLLAFDTDKAVAIACCSTGINTAYNLKKKTALGILTTTITSHRRKGIANALRKIMMQDLKEKGITSVLSDISITNLASEKGCKKITEQENLSFKEISIRYECEI